MSTVVRKARKEDAQDILSILIPYIKQGIVLNRSVEEIEHNIGTFFVAQCGSEICGVVAYYDYGSHLKEIRSLAVKETEKKKGVGRLLIETVLAILLNESPDAKIFTLTYVPEFFLKFGFHIVDKECFPEKIWKDCSNCTKAETCGETALVYGEKVSVSPLD
jgi:amino-acid N-acetyltransferase